MNNQNNWLFTENRVKFIELLKYQTSVKQQIMYNRKNDYFLLINKYLNQLITPYEFQSKFLEMENENSMQAEKILQNFQQLSSFSFYFASFVFSCSLRSHSALTNRLEIYFNSSFKTL